MAYQLKPIGKSGTVDLGKVKTGEQKILIGNDYQVRDLEISTRGFIQFLKTPNKSSDQLKKYYIEKVKFFDQASAATTESGLPTHYEKEKKEEAKGQPRKFVTKSFDFNKIPLIYFGDLIKTYLRSQYGKVGYSLFNIIPTMVEDDKTKEVVYKYETKVSDTDDDSGDVIISVKRGIKIVFDKVLENMGLSDAEKNGIIAKAKDCFLAWALWAGKTAIVYGIPPAKLDDVRCVLTPGVTYFKTVAARLSTRTFTIAEAEDKGLTNYGVPVLSSCYMTILTYLLLMDKWGFGDIIEVIAGYESIFPTGRNARVKASLKAKGISELECYNMCQVFDLLVKLILTHFRMKGFLLEQVTKHACYVASKGFESIGVIKTPIARWEDNTLGLSDITSNNTSKNPILRAMKVPTGFWHPTPLSYEYSSVITYLKDVRNLKIVKDFDKNKYVRELQVFINYYLNSFAEGNPIAPFLKASNCYVKEGDVIMSVDDSQANALVAAGFDIINSTPSNMYLVKKVNSSDDWFYIGEYKNDYFSNYTNIVNNQLEDIADLRPNLPEDQHYASKWKIAGENIENLLILKVMQIVYPTTDDGIRDWNQKLDDQVIFIYAALYLLDATTKTFERFTTLINKAKSKMDNVVAGLKTTKMCETLAQGCMKIINDLDEKKKDLKGLSEGQARFNEILQKVCSYITSISTGSNFKWDAFITAVFGTIDLSVYISPSKILL